MDTLEEAYWAGFIDGEGSISIYKHFNKDGNHKNFSYQLIVCVATTNKAIMEQLAKFGGHPTLTERRFKKLNQRNAYYWQIKADKAALFLKRILPYLRLKKDQAIAGIEFQDHKNQPNKFGGKLRPLNEEEVKYREAMREQLRLLNRRDSNKGGYRDEKNKD